RIPLQERQLLLLLLDLPLEAKSKVVRAVVQLLALLLEVHLVAPRNIPEAESLNFGANRVQTRWRWPISLANNPGVQGEELRCHIGGEVLALVVARRHEEVLFGSPN